MKLEEKAAEGVDGFFDKLSGAMDIVGEKLIDVTPEAAEHLLNLVQFKGIFGISKAGIVLAIVATLATWSWLKLKRYASSGNSTVDEICAWATCNTALTVVSGFVLMIFLDFYNWISAFYPEGAIALKALEAVGINL